MAEAQEQWRSRGAFLTAIVGPLIGLGNIQHFPMLSLGKDESISLVTFFSVFIFVGVPMIILELGLGRMVRSGNAEAFGHVHKRARGLGMAGILSGFIIVSYYVNFMAWFLVYLISSFEWPFPWEGKEEAFFHEKVLRTADYHQVSVAESHTLGTWVLCGLLFIWGCVCLTSIFGTRGIARMAYITVPISVLLVVFMFIYTITLDGTTKEAASSFSEWDNDGVQHSSWMVATSRVLFSNGIALGMMVTYGGYASPSSNLLAEAGVIGFARIVVGLMLGVLVYGLVGHMRQMTGMTELPPNDMRVIALTLIMYPSALQKLPKTWAFFMSASFFFSMLSFGLNTLVALIEPAVAAAGEMKQFRGTGRATIVAFVCFGGFLQSLPYASDLGLSLLRVVHRHMSTYGVLSIALGEALCVSWVAGWRQTRESVGLVSAVLVVGGFFGGIASAVTMRASAPSLGDGMTLFYVAIPVGIGFFLLCVLVASFFRSDSAMSFKKWAGKVAFAGTRDFRMSVNELVERNEGWKIPRIWDILVKFFIPPLLVEAIVSAAVDDVNADHTGKGIDIKDPCGQPATWERGVALAIIGLLLIAVVSFAIFPGMLSSGKESERLLNGEHSGRESSDGPSQEIELSSVEVGVNTDEQGTAGFDDPPPSPSKHDTLEVEVEGRRPVVEAFEFFSVMTSDDLEDVLPREPTSIFYAPRSDVEDRSKSTTSFRAPRPAFEE